MAPWKRAQSTSYLVVGSQRVKDIALEKTVVSAYDETIRTSDCICNDYIHLISHKYDDFNDIMWTAGNRYNAFKDAKCLAIRECHVVNFETGTVTS